MNTEILDQPCALPYYLEILLRPLANHPITGPAITAALDGGNIGGMFAGLFEEGRHAMLSSGERGILRLALALWNGNQGATVADLGLLDDSWRHRACTAITARYCPLWGQE